MVVNFFMNNTYLRSLLLGCLSLAFFFTLVASADAKTLTVSQNGGGDCSTINDCINRMSGGDTVIVKSGIYNEVINDNIPSGNANSPSHYTI